MISLRSQITRCVLGFFFEHEDTEAYVNDLSRRFALDSGNLTRKLIDLEKEGLLSSRWAGEQRYYRLNKQFPLYKEYKGIIKKSIGAEHLLRTKLKTIPGIEHACIFGSYASGKADTASDIDLLIIGSQGTLAVQRAIADVQRQLEREINVISLDAAEYKKKKGQDPLLKRIDQGKVIQLI